MLQFETTLEQVKLTENDVSPKLKKMIQAIRTLLASKETLLVEINNPETDAERKPLAEQELVELNGDISDVDTELAQAITVYAGKKEFYKENTQKMQQKRLEKKGGKGNQKTTSTTTTTTTEPEPIVTSTTTTTTTDAQPIEKKKGNGAAGILVGVGLLILSFGVYNHFKNKD